MLKPLPDPIGIRIMQPGPKNLQSFAVKRNVDAGSNVNIMLPAGSNSRYSATLAAALLGALHNECRDAAMRIIARVDVLSTPAGKNVKHGDAASLDALIVQMNADPSAYADETLKTFDWLRDVERYCEQRGREMILLVQQQTNSRIEAERAVCPLEAERGIVGNPSHVIQVAHVGSLARRQRMGIEDGLSKKGALSIERNNIIVVAHNHVRDPANPLMENPLETASLFAATLEDLGVPLQALRRSAAFLKGLLSK